jgi:hypothetical protein
MKSFKQFLIEAPIANSPLRCKGCSNPIETGQSFSWVNSQQKVKKWGSGNHQVIGKGYMAQHDNPKECHEKRAPANESMKCDDCGKTFPTTRAWGEHLKNNECKK